MKISDMEVTYRYHYGSDLEVVNAARVSFSKESSWENSEDEYADFEDGLYVGKHPTFVGELNEKDKKLINYLAKHNHWSPFGHVGATLRIKSPIFVARQLVKHQVGLVWNEVSRRYVDDEPEFWFPKEWRGKPVSAKQGSSNEIINLDSLADACAQPSSIVLECLRTYTEMINNGVAPEQSRMILPQNTMTEWIWTGSLAAWIRVIKLRTDSHAQLETQQIAHMIKDIISDLFPVSTKALLEN